MTDERQDDQVQEDVAADSQEADGATSESSSASGAASLDLPDLGGGESEGSSSVELALLGDVDLRVKIELGRTRMQIEDVLRLQPDSIVELDKAAGDPVDIFVNDCHVARGEVLVVNEYFCVRVSEILAQPLLTGSPARG